MESEQLQLGFSAGNGPRTYQLKSEVVHCKQNGEPVALYFGRLKKLWHELNQLDPADCSTKLGAEIERRREEERLYQFLVGLDHENFAVVGSTILNWQPLPSVDRAYSMIFREEEERVKKTITESEPLASYVVARNSTWSNKASYCAVGAEAESWSKRRKASIPSMIVELPEEIVIEILVRLPPNSLLRFSCVSKQLKSIVWDPKFARNYLKFGSRGMLYPYMYHTPHRPDMNFSGWSSKELFVPDHHHHHHRLLLYFRTTLRHNDRRILASSNGLVLSQIHTLDRRAMIRPYHDISLCVSNPLTKQHAILRERRMPFESTSAPPRPWTCGFATQATEVNGSYSISYKVILVVPPKERVLDPANYSSIEIFSSDIGCWQCVPGPISVPRVVVRNGYKAQDFCYKGILHWLDQDGGTRTIVTYDPYESPNKFGYIRMPHNASGQILSSSLMSLIHLGHEEDFPRCCEIERCPGGTSLSLLVWRMVDYDKQLWCLEQRCPISSDSLQLLGGCRQLIAPGHQNPPGVFCYLFVRCLSFRVVAIDLGSGKEEDVSIGNVVSGRRHLYYPPCGTLPLVPFVLCPWSSPKYYNCNKYHKLPWELAVE